MIYKVLTELQGDIFLELSEEIYNTIKANQKTHYDVEFELFLQIPNLTKIDVLEHFEETILKLSTGYFGNDAIELDSMFFTYLLDNKNVIKNNSANPTYISEYIDVIGQLFLAGYIDFGMCGLQDKEENLLSNQGTDKYQAWIHFRDNFFYTDAYYIDTIDLKEKYPNMSDNEYIYSTWDTPQYWDQYTFWVARTPKGEKYFNEILAPRFYNKYKDLEVEIDDKGNIVCWIGEVNR